MTTEKVPLSLLFEQGTMLKTLGGIAVASLLPKRGKQENPTTFEPASMVVKAPSDKLIKSYVQWSGAPADRYQNELPPHLLSQWALPAASAIIKQSRYDIAGVINQGLDMVINGPLPRGENILVAAKLASLTEENNRARLAIEITSGTQKQRDAVVATMHVTFILGPKKKSGARKETDEPTWETQGEWHTNSRDGLNFALLTGDFNPIHWIGLAGKLSPFKSKVLHGFGMLVRTYEVLANNGPTHDISIRFLKPIPLPSPAVTVQLAAAGKDGQQPLRVIGKNGALHLAGHLKR